MDGNWKTTPTPPGNLGPWATTEPGFPEFFSTTLMAQHSFYLPPHGFLWKGGYETNNIPTSTAFMSFLIQKQCYLHLHCSLNLCIRPTLYARRGAHHHGFQSAEQTTTIQLGNSHWQNTTHTGKVSIKTHHPLRKKTRLSSMGGARIFAGTSQRLTLILLS